ncbi:flagellar biosynthetic protein FliO [Alloalcanivorax venustensis]|uniref:flagellar biosynthetic protein FliO n=1 Tax=Alloalcanivorax venustensis TaxID=172371 RepID=UPI003519AB02
MSSADAQTKTGIEAVQAGGDAMLGMAAFGKTALVLVAMVGLILLCGWLLKRFGPGQTAAGQTLKVVASRAVGAKERVVVLELEDTWLVLGVGGGKVTKLHERPAPERPPAPEPVPTSQAVNPEDGFAGRFAQALKANLRGGPGKPR